jgi:hypothetical protein
MSLRGDAKTSAVLAGVYAQTNAAQLKEAVGRAPTEGELYIAHFLGADGAARLIDAATNRPTSRAVDIFPSAAQANRPIFYDRAGNARTTLGVYRELTGRYETARANIGADVAATPLRGTLPPETAVARIPDTAGVARAYAAAQPAVPQPEAVPPVAVQPVAYAPVPKPTAAFQSIFSDTGRQGVAPMVRTLWTTPGDKVAQAPKPRSLFTD